MISRNSSFLPLTPPGFSILFIRTRHWANWFQSPPSLHTPSLASVLILSSHPTHGFSSSSFYDFRLKSSSHCLSPACVLQVHDSHTTGEQYVIWRLLLCNFLQSCATCVVLCQNVLFSSLSSNTFSLSSLLRWIIVKSLASVKFVRLTDHTAYVIQ